LTSYAKFHKIRRHKAGNMVKCTPRVLFKYFFTDFSRASTEKILNNFNGLKCSTVGNLGS